MQNLKKAYLYLLLFRTVIDLMIEFGLICV